MKMEFSSSICERMEQMMRALPPLASLPAFEATARLGSVSAAAEELGRTHGAISKQIRSLSDDLGGNLFEKQGTGLRLTRRGDRLRRELTPMLDALDSTAQSLRYEVDDHHIHLAASATLALRWLTRRIPRFYARCPGVEISVRMTGPERLPDNEIDLVLSYDRLRGDMDHPERRVIGDTAYGVVCAPHYPVSIEGGQARMATKLTQPNAQQAWEAWEEISGWAITAGRELEHPHHFLALEAAAAGLGLGLAEKRIVADDLAAERLIAPLGFVTVKGGLQAAVMERARKRRTVAALLEWLEEEAHDNA